MRRRLFRLTAAATVAATLVAPALAQSERNGRLIPRVVAPAPLPAPTVAVEATVAAEVAGTVATVGEAPPPPTAADPVPTPTIAAPPPPAAVAVPVPRSLPPALPGGPDAAVAAAAAAATTPLPLVPAAAPPPPPPSQAAATPRLRIRTPLPAVRTVAAAVEAAPAAAVAVEATVAVAADALAAEAEALRATAEQERAAVAEQHAAAEASVAASAAAEAADAPVEAAGAEVTAAEAAHAAPDAAAAGHAEAPTASVAAAADADPAGSVAAPQDTASHGPAPHGAAPPPSSATNAAHDAATAEAAPLHDAAPAAPAEPAPVIVAAAADAAPPETAPPAGAPADQAAHQAAAPAADRPGGVRWIEGAGLPPPAAMQPVADDHAAAPDGSDPVDGGHGLAVPGNTHGADGHGDPATAPDGAAADRPRTRRKPSGEPIAAPYQLVRTLQAMQDDMAAGSTTALAAQRALLQRMEEEFANADPLVWQDRRNARALVTYTLGGGRPATLRRLLKSETPPDGDEALMRGALAYVEGDEATARRYLVGIDARTLPASLGGQLAVAQAALVVGEDPKGAMALLDTARLLAPGTLVEEAALRRQIFVASELADVDRFEALSGQYLRRFRRSVYAGNFRRRFAAALTRMTFLDDPAQFRRLDDMLAETEPEARRELYLVVAQAAVNEGKTELAATAAERALSTAPPGSLDEARGRLYRGAALAVSREGFEAAMADLRAIERRDLPRTDAALLQAASETAMLIETAAAGTVPEVVAAVDTEDAEADTPSPTVTKARAAIADVDALLEQAQ